MAAISIRYLRALHRTLPILALLLANATQLLGQPSPGCVWSSKFSLPGSTPPGQITSMAIFDDGTGPTLFAAGMYFDTQGGYGQYVARWTGHSWERILTVPQSYAQATLCVLDDGSGSALYLSTPPMKWHGSSWLNLAPNQGWWSVWYSDLAVFDSGDGPRLFRSQADTANSRGEIYRHTDTSWEIIADTPPWGFAPLVMATFDDGTGTKLYIGGQSRDVGGSSGTDGIARWDGTAWSSVGGGITTGSYTYDYVSALEVIDLGDGPALYAGGHFDSMGGVSTHYVAKWNGQSWEAFGDSLDGWFGVRALAGFDDGTGPALYAAQTQIYLGGGRTPSTRDHEGYQIFKWTDPVWTPLGTGLNSDIESLLSFDDGSGPALYAGGAFSTVDGVYSPYIAKYTCSPKVELALSLTDGITTAMSGDPVLYTLTVQNTGDVTEPAAQLQNTLSQNAACSFTSVAAGGATGNTLAGSGALAEILTLPVGGVVTYQISCIMPNAANQPLTHTATITASLPDSNPANNTATDTNYLGPFLNMPPLVSVAPDQFFDYPIFFNTGGQGIAALAFSLDYDQSCLDPRGLDGHLSHYETTVPVGWTSTVRFDPNDSDGEIDVSAADWLPPVSTFPGGEIFSIRLKPTCSSSTAPIDVPVVFSASPTPSFSSPLAQALPGTWNSGFVRILAGPRGDCNSDSVVAASDLVAVGLEIFDGDGAHWLDAGNGTYPGKPVGCDANASTEVNAADVTCVNLQIFGETCEDPPAFAAGIPRVEVFATFDGSVNWVKAFLSPNGRGVGSLAFSVDLDTLHFDLSRIDINNDGVPDLLRFPSGTPGLSLVAFDAADTDGELDFLLADLTQSALPQGLLVEVGIPGTSAAKRGTHLADEPRPSLGSVRGTDVAGELLEGSLLFRDGFESGNTSNWNLPVP